MVGFVRFFERDAPATFVKQDRVSDAWNSHINPTGVAQVLNHIVYYVGDETFHSGNRVQVDLTLLEEDRLDLNFGDWATQELQV